MTPRQLRIEPADPAIDALRRSLGVRFAEMLESARDLASQNDDARLHALRLAGKRLRYLLESGHRNRPELGAATERLAQLVGALGDVHDCALLIELARADGGSLLARIAADRAKHLLRARALWIDAFVEAGPFSGLIAFTGFGKPVA
jgi:CHAD domain-containing protein